MGPTATLSVAVLARDEGAMIEACLRHLEFADQIIVGVDARTTDDTGARAEALGATVVIIDPDGFAAMRNQLLSQISTQWVLFIDADERVDNDLRKEIQAKLARDRAAYRVPIANWFYGHRIRRSGYRERPVRLMPTSYAHFGGDIHERATLPPDVPIRTLRQPIVHLSHRSISDNLQKTARYAEVQAAELRENGHRPVTRWTLLRVVVVRLAQHLIVGQGVRDGTAGVVESLYQAFSHFCVYARLWEMQQNPSIEDRYRSLEERIT